ncbi:hypothetical protein B0H11DRAFT_2292498 [Mycena galericulata]|nr:hypothetical protein B0H11DRAFT_2292498 [Mycena galericulata]
MRIIDLLECAAPANRAPRAGPPGLNSTTPLSSPTRLPRAWSDSRHAEFDDRPGLRWGPVCDALDPSNLTIIGGRAITVGVGGYIWSLRRQTQVFAAQHGFAAQNLVNYEIVLANGSIANVNQSSFSDLHEVVNGGPGPREHELRDRHGIYGYSPASHLTYPLTPIWGEVMQRPPHWRVIFSYLRNFNSSEADIAFAMLGEYFNGDGPLTDAFEVSLAAPFIPGTDLIKNNTDQQELAGQVDLRFDVFEKAQATCNARLNDKPDISRAASFKANGRAQWLKIAETPNFQGIIDGDYTVPSHIEVIDWMNEEAH